MLEAEEERDQAVRESQRLARDRSRRKLAQSLAQVQELVRFDKLTKALNRRSLVAQLLHRADVALYEARRTGRDRVVIA